MPPNYFTLFSGHRPDEIAKRLANNVEALVEDLNNSTSPQILSVLGDMPVLYREWNALAVRTSPRELGAGRALSPRTRGVAARLALPFPFGTRFAATSQSLNRLDEAFAEMFPDAEPISADAQSKAPNFQPKFPTPQSAEDDK